MIKILDNTTDYFGFINDVNSDSSFRDPMLRNEEQIRCNLLNAPNNPDNLILGVFDGDRITGLFVFLVLENESYAEMLVGLSRHKEAYDEIISYLKDNINGYNIDFIYNPNNHLLHSALKNENAQFETEQQKMILKNEVAFESDHHIELYSEKYREQYISMHSAECYWTAEKILNAPDRFRIILAIENDQAVGYIDITHKYDENEPYDIFVKECCRNMGYAKSMMAKAIELNKPNGMMLLVDIDNTAAIALYESLGFVRAAGENNICAHIKL